MKVASGIVVLNETHISKITSGKYIDSEENAIYALFLKSVKIRPDSILC